MPSENVLSPNTAASANLSAPSVDRRTRKRDARRAHLLDLAADLVEEVGVAGITMAALADASDYAPASLYTYFSSRSALLAALQQRALLTLGQVAEAQLASWDEQLAASRRRPSDEVVALARLWAFSDLFLSAPDRYPREFRLQQQLLVTDGSEDAADAATVAPVAMLVLGVPRQLLAAAVEAGGLDEPLETLDPLGNPLDGALLRTFSWIVGLNGALLADRLTTGLPVTGSVLGSQLTTALLRGWGGRPSSLTKARDLSSAWVSFAHPAVSTDTKGIS